MTAREFIELEKQRQENTLELIASENYTSGDTLDAVGSVFMFKYAEGYPGHRYYGGCEIVDMMENACREGWKKVFKTDYHVNVQPHSGSSANMAAMDAVLHYGDTVLSMELASGGHLSHGAPVSFSGKKYNVKTYGVGADGWIDYDEVLEKAYREQPKLIIAGASAYSRFINYKRFAEIAKMCGAYLLVDMAHVAGLIAAGEHPSPFGIADIVTTTTQKTLRSARGGMIFCKPELAKKIDAAVFPGNQGGPLENMICGKLVGAEEALTPEFRAYQHQVVMNAKTLAERLIFRGVKLVSGGTDNHMVLCDFSGTERTGKDVTKWLEDAHIAVNANCVPGEKRSPKVTSGIRVGTPAVTTRGMKGPEMVMIADMLADIIEDGETAVESVGNRAARLLKKYPLYAGKEE